MLGDAARWATVTPETLPLFPDAEGQVSISFKPARVSAARAGATPFGVKVTSEVDPSDTSVEEGTLEIGTFTELTGELVPLISHGSRTGKHQLACDNRGNTPLTLAFGGVDQEEALRFAFNPTTVVAEPGTATIVTVRAHPRKRFLTGTAEDPPLPDDHPAARSAAGERSTGRWCRRRSCRPGCPRHWPR